MGNHKEKELGKEKTVKIQMTRGQVAIDEKTPHRVGK